MRALGHRVRKRCEINENDPLSARIEIAEEMELERDDWCVRLTATTRFCSTITDFLIEAEIRAFQGTDLIHHRAWQLTQPRDLVWNPCTLCAPPVKLLSDSPQTRRRRTAEDG
jgi:hypothetical protein